MLFRSLAQWDSILRWLQPLLEPLQAANDASPDRPAAARVVSARPASLMPAQESLLHGTRLGVMPAARTAGAPAAQQARVLPDAAAGRASIPRMLKR